MVNKKGMDTRALNILLSVFILVIVIGGVYAWLAVKFAGAQKEPLVAAAGISRLDRELSKFVSSVPELLDSSREEELEIKLSDSLKETFLDVTVDCEQESVLECDLTVIERKGAETSKRFSRSVFLPTKDGIKEVRFSGTLRQ